MEMFIHLMERHLKRNFKKSEKNVKMILCQACKSGNMELFKPKSPFFTTFYLWLVSQKVTRSLKE